MKRLSSVILSVIGVVLLSSCSILPKPTVTEIHYYDIGFPEKNINTELAISVLTFTGGVGADSRMVFRNNTNKVQFDAYNRWSYSPAKLVQRYLSLAFDDNKIAPTMYMVKGEILRFDGNIENKTANLSMKIDTSPVEGNTTISSEVYSVSIPVKNETATAYAEAMQKAMHVITLKIEKQLKSLKKR